MGPASVTGDGDAPAPTIFTVLADTARAHSRRYLLAEASLAGATAALLLDWRPAAWPAASLALAVCLYACWGLLARDDAARGSGRRHLLRLIVAGLATVAVLCGAGGLALKAFWGTAPGPYGACYRPDGTSYACNADGSRRAVAPPPT